MSFSVVFGRMNHEPRSSRGHQTLESRRIMTETIKTLLQPIQNRLNAAGKEPSRWLTGNDGNPVYYQSLGAKAEFIANVPTDQARLLAAVQAVTAMHQEDLFRGHLSNGCKVCAGGEWPCETVTAIESALTEAR